MTDADFHIARPDPTAPEAPATVPAFPSVPGGTSAPEFSVGAAPVRPAFAAPDPNHTSPAYPPAAYPPPAYPPQAYPPQAYPAQPYPAAAQPPPPGYGGYGGYGVQPSMGYPMYVQQPKTNGLSIAALVVSCAGAVFLICYGVGGLVGVVGAILGHVARKQIRQRQEGGDGMALAGIIVGWIATGLGLAIIAAVIGLFAWLANSAGNTDYSSDYPTYNAIKGMLAALI